MRTTMHISLPETLRSWVERQVEKRGFSTASEFVRDVLRREQELERTRARIDRQLVDALDSGPSTPMTAKDWSDIRKEARKRFATRRKS